MLPIGVCRRSFAILVNFNVDPNVLYEDASFVRSKLLAAIDATKLIGQRSLKDHANANDDLPLQLYRLKHDVLCKQKLDRAFHRYELLEGRLLLPKYSHRACHCSHEADDGDFVAGDCGRVFGERQIYKCVCQAGDGDVDKLLP